MSGRLCVLALTLTTAWVDAGGPAKERDALQGSWKIVGATNEGKKDRIDPDRAPIVIKGDRIEGLLFHKGEPAEVTFVVDPGKKPKTIHLEMGQPKLEMGSKKIEGIYELTGDTLRLALGLEESRKQPKNFATSIIFKKLKK